MATVTNKSNVQNTKNNFILLNKNIALHNPRNPGQWQIFLLDLNHRKSLAEIFKIYLVQQSIDLFSYLQIITPYINNRLGSKYTAEQLQVFIEFKKDIINNILQSCNISEEEIGTKNDRLQYFPIIANGTEEVTVILLLTIFEFALEALGHTNL